VKGWSALLMVFAATAAVAAAPAENPSVDTRSLQSAVTASDQSGTTIFGERESAMGLYLTPWKNESPGDIDRPPFLADQSADLIDADDFRQQIQTKDMIAAYRRAQMQRWR
jgi:hypothetical protein